MGKSFWKQTYFFEIPCGIRLFTIVTNTNLLNLSNIWCFDFKFIHLEMIWLIKIKYILLLTAFRSKLSDLFLKNISSVLPFKPYIWMNTFASVPAPNLSPVNTVISYGIAKSRIVFLHKQKSLFDVYLYLFSLFQWVWIQLQFDDHFHFCPTNDYKQIYTNRNE